MCGLKTTEMKKKKTKRDFIYMYYYDVSNTQITTAIYLIIARCCRIILKYMWKTLFFLCNETSSKTLQNRPLSLSLISFSFSSTASSIAENK